MTPASRLLRCALPRADRRVAGALAILVLAAAPAARGEGDAPESRRVLLRAAGPAPPSADTTWLDIEELLVRGPELSPGLADGETLPDGRPEAILDQVGALSCGTPLARAAEAALARSPENRRAALALLAAPPRLATELTLAVSGEPLVVRWDGSSASRHALLGRDTDGDRMPDAAQAVADDARNALRRLADLTGWDRRVEGGVIEVRIAATPFAEGAALPGPSPVVVLPRDARAADRLASLSHQLAHVLVREMAPSVPASFEECVATWLGETVFADLAGVSVEAACLLPARHAARAILSPGIGSARSDAGFLRHVTDVAGLPPTWVSDVLLAMPRHADELRRSARLAPAEIGVAAVAEALDDVLTRHGLSLADAVAEYQIWSLEQDLLHREADVSVDQELDRLPEDMRLEPSDLPPFGQLRLGIAIPETGGLEIAFEPAETLRAVAVAAFADGSLRRIPLSGERSGLTLPASSLRRLVVLVQSPAIPRRWSRWHVPSVTGGARLVAAINPTWPFVLSSLEAEAAPGQVTLSWETASEEDLTGWLVERALRAAGPWGPVSVIPLPAQSLSGTPASYSFVDATPRPSLRYHYRVRALTRAGLSEMSPPTSIRTLPPAN